MPNIQSKRIRVRDPETGIWHDLPATVSKESLQAAAQAASSASEAEEAADRASAAADAAAASAAYNAQLPVVEAMEAAQAAAVSAEDAAHSLAVVEGQFPEGIASATAAGTRTRFRRFFCPL